jgi:RHS repeat-associated protein
LFNIFKLKRVISFGELNMRIAIFHTVSSSTSLRRLFSEADRLRKAVLLVASIFLLVGTSSTARAQAPGYYLDSIGQPEFSMPSPVELGYVEQANGHLHLEIPIGQAIPYRGNPKGLQFRIAYDSNFWTPTLDDAEVVVWSTGSGTFNLLPGILSARLSGVNGGAIYRDANLTTRYFSVVNPAINFASDSTGYVFMPNVTFPTGGGAVLYGPDGSVLNANLAGVTAINTDPNGNYFSLSSSPSCPAAPAVPGYLFGGGGLCDPAGRPLITEYDSGMDPSTGIGQILYNVPNSQGGLSSYVEKYLMIHVKSAFNQTHIAECNSVGCEIAVIQSILLPDGTSYSFKYDCDPTVAGQSQVCSSPGGQPSYYGEMTQMTLPTGGTINYAWQVFSDAHKNKGMWLASRTAGGGTWTYAPHVISICPTGADIGCQQSLTETTPDGLATTTTFVLDDAGEPFQTQVQNAFGTTNTTWDFTHACTIALPGSGCVGHAYVVKLAETESIVGPGGTTLTKQTKYSYDTVPGQTYTVDGLITAVKEWGYYPGASPTFPSVPDRATYTSYYSPANSPSQFWGGGTNIHRPQTVTVCNNTGSSSACPGGGGMVSQTITSYDTVPTTGISGVLNHDDTRYSASQVVRGLPTQVQKWVGGGTYLTSHFQYDATGQLLTSTDPAGNLTSYDYTDNYFNDNNTSSPAPFSAPGITNTFPKTITLPTVNGVPFVQTFGYYYGSGKKAYSTDFNAQTTYFHFWEPFDRLTSTVFPIGWNLINYVSQNEADVYVPVNDANPSTGCTSCRHERIKYDTLGRKSSQQLVNTPNCAAEVDTNYDLMGRVASASHPYCYGVESPVFETYAYDQLSRVTQVTHPDGQSQFTAYGNIGGAPGQQAAPSTYGYGYPTLSTDEVRNQKQTWTDGLGRLIEVDEPSSTGASSTAGTGTINITGSEQSVTVPPQCVLFDCGGNCIEWAGGRGDQITYYDMGWVSITVNGSAYNYSYGQGDSNSSVASGLAAAINADPNSPVTASAPANIVTVTAKVAGDTTDYSLSAASGTTDQTGNFFSASFTAAPSGPFLNGGTSPGSIGSSPNATFYTYDAANNLLGVVQGIQTRTFAYDGSDRLLTAANPESGTISYTYDADSNVQTKTDARGIVTTMSYDAHNRLTQKTYNDSTPAAHFVYDVSNLWGGTQTFTVGRLMEESIGTGTTATVFNYDPMGRVTLAVHCLPAVCKGLGYGYNSLGGVTHFSNDNGLNVYQSFDAVGRVSQVTTAGMASVPTTLATMNSFTAWDAISQMTYGNGLIETSAYNNRMQPIQLRTYRLINSGAGSSPLLPPSGGDDGPPPPPPSPDTDILNLNYGYANSAGANNGNVTSLTSTATQIFMRSYTYDSLNRLTTMASPADASGCYGLSWTYDRYANRLNQSTASGSCFNSNHAVLANNRIAGFSYDASGNMTGDGIHTYMYDAESQLIQVDGTLGNCSTATACYSYDARGERTEKITSAGKIDYVRDLSGNVAVEWNTATNGSAGWGSGYIYTNGQLLAEYENNTTYFIHKDHLGDTRVMTALDSSIYDSMDYLPYGEQIAGGTGTTHKFTGKERDPESGLDYFDARYYSSNLGRFVSADWSAIPEPVPYADFNDPQSLNLYTYVRNVPTVRIDADGHDVNWWDVVNFTVGAVVALGSDLIAGAGRQTETTTAGKLGQATGDTAATLGGVSEVILGAGGDVAGTGLDATGAGAVAGVPLQVASTAAVVHGAATAATGASNLGHDIHDAMQSSKTADKGSGSQNKPDTRATKAEKNTLEGSQNQRESMTHAKEKLNKTGQGEKIRSTEKTNQREAHQLKQIKSSKDVEGGGN